jgi:hypothetical protein
MGRMPMPKRASRAEGIASDKRPTMGITCLARAGIVEIDMIVVRC